MADIADLIRKDVGVADVAREKNRAAMPATAAMVDRLREAFGPVRVLHAIENGKEVGKPQDYSDLIDANQFIKADDWHQRVQRRLRR